MSDQAQGLRTQERSALEECFVRIRLAHATELAQSGRLLEAEAVLTQNGELPRNASELDLLARIAARLGRFDEARRRWNAAIQIEPGNETYRQCIEQLTPARRIVRWVANSQDGLLAFLIWVTITFEIGVLIYVFRSR